MVYPEGTLTRDPDLWPMVGKSGAARIALETGCPVIPVGQWGAQEMLAPYAKKPDLFPRKHDHDEGRRPGPTSPTCVPAAEHREVIAEATDRIMAAITALVADLRGETAPAERFDPRTAGVTADRQPHASRNEGAQSMSKVAVFGAGSWGTAFSIVLADAGNDVTIWGAPRGGRRRDQRARTRTPTTCPASSCRRRSRATHDPERGRRRRRHRRPRRAVADAARQPRRVGAAPARATP